MAIISKPYTVSTFQCMFSMYFFLFHLTKCSVNTICARCYQKCKIEDQNKKSKIASMELFEATVMGMTKRRHPPFGGRDVDGNSSNATREAKMAEHTVAFTSSVASNRVVGWIEEKHEIDVVLSERDNNNSRRRAETPNNFLCKLAKRTHQCRITFILLVLYIRNIQSLFSHEWC